MAKTMSTRFGIIGCGTASVPVCEAIAALPLTELTAVYDLNIDMARDISERFHAPVMGTLEEMLNNPAVDAIYIAVPHYLLASLTRQTLEAGKHALTEKPLAISVEDIDSLIALAAERQLTLGVFYEMRYAPAHEPARDLIQAGAIGKIIGVRIQTLIDKSLTYWQTGYAGRSNNPWRGIKAQAGGGVVLMNTSHILDAVGFITGLSVTSVSAEIGTLVADVEVEDTAAATLRFDNGAIGSLMAGAHISGAHSEECCHIYGTLGQLRLPDPYGPSPLQLYLQRAWDQYSADQWHSLPLEAVPVYERAVENFAQAVQAKQPAPIDGKAARQVLSI
ncbi:MAG: Gfo/Idh/MocA family oxidoreductase, partial [Chloroflexota bacterium]